MNENLPSIAYISKQIDSLYKSLSVNAEYSELYDINNKVIGRIPSLKNMESKLNSISSGFTYLKNSLEFSNFVPTINPSVISPEANFEVYSNNIRLSNKITKVKFDLDPRKSSYTVLVRRYEVDIKEVSSSAAFGNLDLSSYNEDTIVASLVLNNMKFSLSERHINSTSQFGNKSGKFTIVSSKINGASYELTLSNLDYSIGNNLYSGKLSTDDILSDGSKSLYTVKSVDTAANKVTLQPNIGTPNTYVLNVNSTLYLVSAGGELVNESRVIEDEILPDAGYIYFFYNTYNGLNRTLVAETSPLYVSKVISNTLTTSNGISLSSYWSSSIKDYRGVIDSISNLISHIPIGQGVSPDAPVLDPLNFTVTPLYGNNTKGTSTSAYSQLQNLQSKKTTALAELSSIDTRIDAVKRRLFLDQYGASFSRSSKGDDIALLQSLYTSRAAQLTICKDIVNQIEVFLTDNTLDTNDDTCVLVGGWDLPDEVNALNGVLQHNVQFRYRYRVASMGQGILVYNVNGQPRVASTWTYGTTALRDRDIDGTWLPIVNSPNQEDPNELSILVKYGAVIELQLKTVTEVGYPLLPVESDWSSTLSIDTKNYGINLDSIKTIIDNNELDKLVLSVDDRLDYYGLKKHVGDSYTTDNNGYFAHNSNTIDSGFKSEDNRRPVDLFSYLNFLGDKINTIASQLNLAQNNIFEIILRIPGNLANSTNTEYVLKDKNVFSYTTKPYNRFLIQNSRGFLSGDIATGDFEVLIRPTSATRFLAIYGTSVDEVVPPKVNLSNNTDIDTTSPKFYQYYYTKGSDTPTTYIGSRAEEDVLSTPIYIEKSPKAAAFNYNLSATSSRAIRAGFLGNFASEVDRGTDVAGFNSNYSRNGHFQNSSSMVKFVMPNLSYCPYNLKTAEASPILPRRIPGTGDTYYTNQMWSLNDINPKAFTASLYKGGFGPAVEGIAPLESMYIHSSAFTSRFISDRADITIGDSGDKIRTVQAVDPGPEDILLSSIFNTNLNILDTINTLIPSTNTDSKWLAVFGYMFAKPMSESNQAIVYEDYGHIGEGLGTNYGLTSWSDGRYGDSFKDIMMRRSSLITFGPFANYLVGPGSTGAYLYPVDNNNSTIALGGSKTYSSETLLFKIRNDYRMRDRMNMVAGQMGLDENKTIVPTFTGTYSITNSIKFTLYHPGSLTDNYTESFGDKAFSCTISITNTDNYDGKNTLLDESIVDTRSGSTLSEYNPGNIRIPSDPYRPGTTRQ